MLTIIEQLVPSLLGNLDAGDLVRQVNEPENSLHANVYRQLENSMFGLSGSRRNLSLYRNRLVSNFVSVLNLRHLDVLVHLVVHFSDGSVVVVHSRSRTSSEDLFLQWKNLFSVFSVHESSRTESFVCPFWKFVCHQSFLSYPLLY